MKKSMKITCPLFAVLLLLLCSVTAMAQNSAELAKLAIQRSTAAYKAKDYDTAIKEANEVIRLSPNWFNGYLLRGSAYYLKNNLERDCDKIIADLTEVIRLKSDDIQRSAEAFGIVYEYRGTCYFSKEYYKKAVDDFETAKRLGYNDDILETKLALAKVATDLDLEKNSTTTKQPTTSGSTTFTDSRDGKQYKKVTIGSQTWMAENLNYNASGSKCYYNQESNCQKYGRLYNWNTAKTACPSGWHLPSNADWNVLIKAVGGDKTAGKYLKATSGWNNNGNGTDNYGFAALPGGTGFSSGNFSSVGDYGYWRSASEYGSNGAYNWIIYYNYEYVNNYNYDKSYLQSVRCVQN